MSTYTPKPGDVTRAWYVIDATDVVLGRLAVEAAKLLRGKHKPTFTPNVDGGDFVIVINAEKVEFSGRKLDQKVYRRYTGYQGGLKETTAREMLSKHPVRVLEHGVWGMLPKTRMGRRLIRRLKVYAGEAHPHQALAGGGGGGQPLADPLPRAPLPVDPDVPREDQPCARGPGGLGDGPALHVRGVRGDPHHDAGPEQPVGAGPADQVPDHDLGHVVVGDHALAHGAHDLDVGRSAVVY